MAKSSSGDILKPNLRAEIWQNYQEVEFINKNYRQRYCKIIKGWNFITKITGRYIAIFSRGGVLKPKL